MIVIADTSPLNYLIQIGEVEVLFRLYQRVIIPQAVLRELSRNASPLPVREWVASPPAWLEVRKAIIENRGLPYKLGAGELEAIALAEDLAAELLLMDDNSGRRVAEKRGLHVTGTFGILIQASRRGFLDIYPAISQLQQTNFYISPDLIKKIPELLK